MRRRTWLRMLEISWLLVALGTAIAAEVLESSGDEDLQLAPHPHIRGALLQPKRHLQNCQDFEEPQIPGKIPVLEHDKGEVTPVYDKGAKKCSELSKKAKCDKAANELLCLRENCNWKDGNGFVGAGRFCPGTCTALFGPDGGYCTDTGGEPEPATEPGPAPGPESAPEPDRLAPASCADVDGVIIPVLKHDKGEVTPVYDKGAKKCSELSKKAKCDKAANEADCLKVNCDWNEGAGAYCRKTCNTLLSTTAYCTGGAPGPVPEPGPAPGPPPAPEPAPGPAPGPGPDPVVPASCTDIDGVIIPVLKHDKGEVTPVYDKGAKKCSELSKKAKCDKAPSEADCLRANCDWQEGAGAYCRKSCDDYFRGGYCAAAAPPDPAPDPAPDPSRESLVKVAAYYYSWWGPDKHRNNTYMRELLDPPQWPALGVYDDTDPAVINQHIEWSRQANIKVWFCTWWGPNKREDTTLRNVILPIFSNLQDMEHALIYETRNRVPFLDETLGVFDFSNVEPDMQHIATNFFSHPNHLRINGRPVLVVYVTRFYHNRGVLGEIVRRMRSVVPNIYIIGDQVWGDLRPVDYDALALLDGATNYDVYGNLNLAGDKYARKARVDNYQARAVAWKAAGKERNCAFFPSLTPGLNKKGRLSPLSRKLDESSDFGSLFELLATNAVALADDVADRIIMVTSLNEWHEDTQIEPVAAGQTTNQPNAVTHGLDYEAYGERYLNILRDTTTVVTTRASNNCILDC